MRLAWCAAAALPLRAPTWPPSYLVVIISHVPWSTPSPRPSITTTAAPLVHPEPPMLGRAEHPAQPQRTECFRFCRVSG